MTSEHLLDAMGLLDDDLIQQAEDYRPSVRPINYRAWMSLAACLAVVLTLGYALTHIRMGGGSAAPENSMSGGGQNAPAASAPAGSNLSPDVSDRDQAVGYEPQAPEAPSSSQVTEPGAPPSGDFRPAIMVDGVLYYSTGTPVSGEVDQSAIRQVTAYINTLPQMDGQTNFSQDLSAQYILTDMGVVVLMDGEWILFEPAP